MNMKTSIPRLFELYHRRNAPTLKIAFAPNQWRSLLLSTACPVSTFPLRTISSSPHLHSYNSDNNNPISQKKYNHNKRVKKTWRQANKKKAHPKKQPFPTSSWVYIPKVPRHANLEDILVELENVMKKELNRGILDLDALAATIQNQNHENENTKNTNNMDDQSEDGSHDSIIQPKYWDPEKSTPTTSYPAHMVMEARSCLEPLKRPTGWFLRFPNRSVVHSLLEHIQTVSPLYCGHFALKVFESLESDKVSMKRRYEAENLCLDDSVLRLEHAPHYFTESDVYNLFRWYELDDYGERPPVELLVEGNTQSKDPSGRAILKTPDHWHVNTNTFLVRLAAPSDARAAIRDLQGKKVGYSRIVLSQYPRQILSKNDY